MTLSLRLLMGLFLAVILAIEVTWLDRKAFGPRALRKGPHYPLVISPRVQSPLSVGLWSIHVVLPEHPYSPEQLSLILKHELIHILRRDSLSKFFFATCTALCWFNPLMWLAMDRSAQDMELSCDEAVLFNADPDTRRTYAGLLLDTAGDSRGFTTHLSASASSLRYRLKRIVKPTRRLAGSLLAGAAAFGLVMTSGFVSLAYETTPAAELLFSNGSQEDYVLRSVALTAPSSPEAQWSCTDPEALLDYLAGLEGRKITGGYTLSDATHQLSIRYENSQRSYRVVLSDDYLICRPRSSSVAQEGVYLISGGVDWDVLTGLLEPEPPLQ